MNARALRSAGRDVVSLILVGAACASPVHETSGPADAGTWHIDPDLALFRSLLGHIDRLYVDAPDFSIVAAGAVQGLGEHLPAGSVTVTESASAITIRCRRQGTARYDVTLPRNATRENAIRTVTGVYRAPCAKSGERADVVEHTMMISVLKRLDRDSSLLPSSTSDESGGGTVGATLTAHEGSLALQFLLANAPADRAGLRSGDRIVKIDGSPTTGMSPSQAHDRLRGTPGTTVTVTVSRSDWPSPRDIPLTRERVSIPRMVTHRLPDGLAYIGLRTLAEDTPKAVDRALADVGTRPNAGLILDLRDNPGGLLTDAVVVAEKFLEEKKLVVYTQGRERAQNMRFSANPTRPYRGFVGTSTYTDGPMVVLVNEGTAAGAEIVAGALQDWQRARLVGMRTPGRTSIQTFIRLSEGATLKLTTARWFTARGRALDRTGGLVPDITVDTSDSVARVSNARFAEVLPRDAVVQAAIAHLRGLLRPTR